MAIYRFAGFELDGDACELRYGDKPTGLNVTPARVLRCLAESHGRVVSHRELFENVWPEAVVGEAALTTAIKQVRQALGDERGEPRFIRTWRGRGYQFCAPVSVEGVGLQESPDLPIRSLAVLPLENLSGEREQEFFADGMTAMLINEIGKLASLRVISRTSVARHRGTGKSLRAIASELDVEGVLEGAVMSDGDRIRITTELIDARTETRLWSERYDQELSQVLALQAEVARAVARELRVTFSAVESAGLNIQRKVDPRAYTAFLHGVRGYYQGETGSPRSLRDMMQHFELATELDPSFAEAYAHLAGLQVFIGGHFSRVRELAESALELDEHLGMAHMAIGVVRLQLDWDFTGAGRAYERAIQLSPNDPGVLASYASYLIKIGRIEEGIAVSERACRLAPTSVTTAAARVDFLCAARRYDLAMEQIGRVRELQPGWVGLEAALPYWHLGRYEEAYEALVAYYRHAGPAYDWARVAAERGWAASGWEGAQRAVFEAAKQRKGGRPTRLAIGAAGVGETDEAFTLLERAYRERDPLILTLYSDPFFDPIRSDPRFAYLLRRIGFPQIEP